MSRSQAESARRLRASRSTSWGALRALLATLFLVACGSVEGGSSPVGPGPGGGGGPGSPPPPAPLPCPEYAANLLPPVPAPATGFAVVPGSIPANFAVTHSGSAHYTMPLEVAPGRGGLHPQLAITYDSDAGDGLMGMRFALTGLSAITRCPRDLHPKDKEGHEIEESISLYSVEQDVIVESAEVEKIAGVSRDATKLLEQGIQIQSDSPKYLYTKLADLKLQLLAEAAKDARHRAEQIASNTGARIEQLNTARMGVIQVNAANELTTSGDGVNDTSSLEKDALVIVTATFGID